MERWKELWKESEKVREIVEREGLEIRLGILHAALSGAAAAVYRASIGLERQDNGGGMWHGFCCVL